MTSALVGVCLREETHLYEFGSRTSLSVDFCYYVVGYTRRGSAEN